MGWYGSADERREQKREERRRYEADVFYDVWAGGRDPDRIDMDRVGEHFWNGYSASEAADREIRAQRQQEAARRQELEDEECCESQDGNE